MDKKELRKQVRLELQNISDIQYRNWSSNIMERLLLEETIQKSKTIAITISRKTEVDTTPIIEALWKKGKRVVVPKCYPQDHTMEFYVINDFAQLETVYMDLKEPIPTKSTKVSSSEIDVMIVPGVVFDLEGYRIGYGGGYYDRYLEYYLGEKISIAFELQLVDNVTKEPYDIPVNVIITENRRIDCKNRREGFAD